MVFSFWRGVVQFSSIQVSMLLTRARDSPYALHSPLSDVSCVIFQTVPVLVWLTIGPFSSSSEGGSSRASSFHASFFQAIVGVVVSLALCPHTMSQDSQYFRSSKEQFTCDGCFLFPSVYLLGHFLWLRHAQNSTSVEGLLYVHRNRRSWALTVRPQESLNVSHCPLRAVREALPAK